LTALPEPRPNPERSPEPAFDVSVPNRAGAIVAEFISSIVGEAQARADQIVVAAGEESGPKRQAAVDALARVRECQGALASELASLRDDLRREADWLYDEPRIRERVEQPVRPAGAELAVREEDVEVVHGEIDEDAGDALVTRQAAEPAKEAREPGSRFRRMSDEELARAYANAAKVATRDPVGDRAESMRRLAAAALQEALTRPAFAEEHEGSGGRRRGLSRSRRRKDAAHDELRAACRRALAK
jgi:hypothetical protein